MSQPDRYFDWHRLAGRQDRESSVVDSHVRLRLTLLVFVLLIGAVFARVIALEVSYGAAFRAEADKPLERTRVEPAVRGRILAADGTVLALKPR